MSKRPRRNHTPAFKAKVALAAIKGDRTLAQLAEQFIAAASRADGVPPVGKPGSNKESPAEAGQFITKEKTA